ncbi:hypothetical protein AB0K89_26365 [Streptomyces cinnamoneus]|uniref:hypothetical protein n=1 Tax=Streptomyces cinnamoneus TaxID=53446 RepID=UPI00343B3ACB
MSGEGITDHPLRAALALLVLGLAGPAAVLHQEVGHLMDAFTDETQAVADTQPSDH